MLESQFKNLKYLTLDEVKLTGADVAKIQFDTLLKLDRLRETISIPVKICSGGLTNGEHRSKEHPAGEAVDFYFLKTIDCEIVFKTALIVGYHGIGIYYNKETGLYSFHCDTRSLYSFWAGRKEKRSDTWTYSNLIKDPKYPC